MVEVWALFPAFALGFAVACLIFMFFTCNHEYETRIHKVEKVYADGILKKTYWIYIQTCKHCGKIKTKTIGLKG